MAAYITQCPVGCGQHFVLSKVHLPEGDLKRCQSCGQLVSQCTEQLYWDSMQEFDCPQGTLPQGKSARSSFEMHKKRLESVADIMHKSLSHMSLLDVGCSSGAFLRSCIELGIDAVGVEPAKQAAQAAVAAGLKVHNGNLEALNLPSNSYEVVTLFEVIEHLKAPKVVLAEAYRLLKPGGVMVVGTGNANSWTAFMMKGRWEYYQIGNHGGHISFFNPKSISKLAAQVGFEVVDIVTRRVRFYEPGQVSKPVYKLTKLCAELLNLPARVLRKGHDMCVYMRKPL